MIGLLLIAALAALGVSFPFPIVASDFIGFSCGAGILAFFVADYAPKGPRLTDSVRVAETTLVAVPVARTSSAKRHPDLQVGPPIDEGITVNIMATLGQRADPSTVSLA